jgi:hypothetical protein
MLVVCAYIITALTFPTRRDLRIFVNFPFSQPSRPLSLNPLIRRDNEQAFRIVDRIPVIFTFQITPLRYGEPFRCAILNSSGFPENVVQGPL